MLIFTLFLALLVPRLSLQQQEVETELGRIRGTTLRTQNNSYIHAFLGIPYAEAPIGDLRFENPVPVKPWNEVYDASRDSLICPQTGVEDHLMSEDCLKLNVFTRNITAKQPVIVYIHGGANMRGSGHRAYEAGPEYLLDYDVVLVAFNYRLGALGFLSTKSEEAKGNFGYLDQVLALQWVQKHIHKFGGDPDRVTIFGLSAGAMAVSLHMTSKLSKGLFHRAIAMSGSATNHYAIDNLYWTRKLAREVKCPMYNPKDVIDCLRSKSWKEIIEVCSRWEVYGFINMKWNYEIDGYFLNKHPLDVFKAGEFHQVPLLAGITRDELDFSLYHQENNTGLLNDISLNFDLYAPEMFLYNASHNYDVYPPKSQQIQRFYFPNATAITKDNIEQLGQAFSDAIIGHGVHELINAASKQMPVYYYRFDHVGLRSRFQDNNGRPRGVGHADDIRYVMPGSWYGPQIALDDPDMPMVKHMTSFWTTFAQDGKPSLPDNEDFHWLPTNGSKIWTLYIDQNLTIAEPPYQDRFNMWDGVFSDEPIVSGSNVLKISLLAVLAYFGLCTFVF